MNGGHDDDENDNYETDDGLSNRTDDFRYTTPLFVSSRNRDDPGESKTWATTNLRA